jgi:type I restriction enzyme S subunit
MSNSIKELLELSDLPNGWAVVTLEALVREGLIGLVRSQKEQSVHEGHPYVRMQHYDLEGNWNFLDLTKVLASLEELKRYELKKGDVLFNTRNSYELVGKVAIWDLDTPGYLYNNNILRLRFFNCILPKLVGYQMMSPQFRERLALSKSATTSVCAIYGKDLYCQPLLLPPLNEQRRIVAKFEALKARSQRVKEELEPIAPLLDQFRQSVLAAAFRGDLTADWREKNPDVEPASELLKQIQKEASTHKRNSSIDVSFLRPFELPTQWEWVTLADICQSITDGDHQAPPKVDKGIHFLVISNISSGRLDFSETRYVPQDYYQSISESRKPRKGDLLYTVVGATYGIPVLVDTEIEFCFQRHIALLKPHYSIVNKYLLYILKADFVYRQATDATTGTAQPTVPLSGLRKIRVPLPPLTEQYEIVQRVESLLKTADRTKQQFKQAKSQLDKLDRSILAKAFRGELVPQDPNDEPASVLLERIRAERENLDTKKKAKGKTEKKSHKAKPEPAEPEQLSLPGFE